MESEGTNEGAFQFPLVTAFDYREVDMTSEEGTGTCPGSCEVTDPADPFIWHRRNDCTVRQVLDRIADKWSLLVISMLDDRSLRFMELRRSIDGISQRMLTSTLRQLERDGIVKRTVFPTIPPRVDYALTPIGESLLDTVKPLVTWTEAHTDAIAAARNAYDAREAEETQPIGA
jgi:DNA-binding HxlR family transcriptional regulator